MGSLAYIPIGERSLALDVQGLANQFMRLDVLEPSRVLACMVSRSSLYDRIRVCQYEDPHLLFLKDTIQHDDAKEVSIGDDGVLRVQGRICVLNVDGLCELILEEAHSSRYSIHPGATKRYQDMRQHYWQRRMKKDIVEFVAQYLNCQQKGKLSPQYIIPFEVLERIGEVTYKLVLPPSLSSVHLVFHVSMLRKYFGDPSYVFDFNTVQLDRDLNYYVELVAILDRYVRKLRSKNIASMQVQWIGQLVGEATWETEREIQSSYPYLFET
ncbi:uncharacterized protein [Nicotiana tomentosiformis]|uniref:uncharacterized protein n=1 Tax=Nicotiana tomentosiformis TaxID=4098 RepID=UPI00388C400E